MTLEDFANEKNIDIEKLLKLCDELGLDIYDKRYVLREEEKKILEDKITFLNINNTDSTLSSNSEDSSLSDSLNDQPSGDSSNYQPSSDSSNTSSSSNSYTQGGTSNSRTTSTNSNMTFGDRILSQIDYDVEDVYNANENIKQVSNDFDTMADKFNSVNVTCEDVSLEPLNESKNIINEVKSGIIDIIKGNTETIKELINTYDETANLLFKQKEEEKKYNDNEQDATEEIDVSEVLTEDTSDDKSTDDEGENDVSDALTEDTFGNGTDNTETTSEETTSVTEAETEDTFVNGTEETEEISEETTPVIEADTTDDTDFETDNTENTSEETTPVTEAETEETDSETKDTDNEKTTDTLTVNAWDVWDGERLLPSVGFNIDAPNGGKETWYMDENHTDYVGVAYLMKNTYNYPEFNISARDDGVAICSGITPEGEKFENLVLVAGDTGYSGSVYERGAIVETSLGYGIMADACYASHYFEYDYDDWFDIAAFWDKAEYKEKGDTGEGYDTNADCFVQVVPEGRRAFDNTTSNNSAQGTNNSVESITEETTSSTAVELEEPKFEETTTYVSETNDSIEESTVSTASNDEPSFETDNIEIISEESTPVIDAELEETNIEENTTESNNNQDETSNLQPKNNSTIAHRGYNTGSGIGWNILEHFENAGEQGYWGCETDVILNSNGELVCSHNSVKAGEEPPLFSDYLDVCKTYGMTAIIDMKYNLNSSNDTLAGDIVDLIREKDMFDSCIIQTNKISDIPVIRAQSSEARIWLLDLKDRGTIPDTEIQIIKDNKVECVNIAIEDFRGIQEELKENDIDVCVWHVCFENTKERLLNQGVKYIMTDNLLDVTPYQEGEEDFNNLS